MKKPSNRYTWGLAIGLVVPSLHAAVLPYGTPDADTVYLYHFNETAGATVAANAISGGFNAIAFDGNPSANHATNPQPTVSTILGTASYSGFGNAANVSAADFGLGVDANQSGGFQFGLDGGTSPDAVTHGSFSSANGSFTIDAIINLPAITGAQREIVCTDNSLANASRGFQFRVNTNGQLEFNFIGTNTTTSTVAIPTTGTHAFVANQWFHVALSFDGATNTSTFYWTRIDPSLTQANAIGTSTTETVSTSVSGPLVIGNEARSASSGVHSAEGLRGLIDEVRISKVVRTASQFIFVDASDSDSDGLPDAWEILNFGNLDATAEQDPDADLSSNFDEYQAGSNPNNPLSTPTDVDADGLTDSWEIAYFNNLSQTASGDPDNDFNTNQAEHDAGSEPNNDQSWPDSDGDLLNDGWEIFWFNDTLSYGPGDDPDGDLHPNSSEYTARTNPTNQLSSPDSDADGLIDGWEVLHFAQPGDDLTTALARTSGTSDPDGDQYHNEIEETLQTNPTTLQKPTDLDADGLIDSWETHYFSNLNATAEEDSDGDSFSNLQELLAGSAPNSPTSTPADTNGNGIPDASESLKPYTSDAHTLHLWHLDEVDQAAVDSAPGALALTALSANARLWDTSLPGFHTALNPSANRATTTGGVLSALPLSATETDDTTMTYCGPDGAFTFEALVRVDFNPAAPAFPTVPMQIVTGDGDIGANRIWQFRILPTAGAPVLQFINIHQEVGVQQIEAPIPVSGSHAITQGQWFHVAVTYNGQENTAENLSLYWTSALPGNTEANRIATSQMTQDLAIGKPDFTIGNEGRDLGGTTDAFAGLVDEVRISSVARSSTQFLFAAAGDTDGDGLPDAWEISQFGNLDQPATGDFDQDGTSNLTEFRLGLNPALGSSRFAAQLAQDHIQWHGAAGLSFTIQRSTSLLANDWSDLATVTATAGLNRYTDPNPPSGRAFYRVVLND